MRHAGGFVCFFDVPLDHVPLNVLTKLADAVWSTNYALPYCRKSFHGLPARARRPSDWFHGRLPPGDYSLNSGRSQPNAHLSPLCNTSSFRQKLQPLVGTMDPRLAATDSNAPAFEQVPATPSTATFMANAYQPGTPGKVSPGGRSIGQVG